MKKHKMHLNDNIFDVVDNGNKNIEYRVNDPKRMLVEEGDEIEFVKRSNELLTINVIVEELKCFKGLLEMYSHYFEECFKATYDNPEQVVEDTPYYSDEEIKEYGCVAIRFRRL